MTNAAAIGFMILAANRIPLPSGIIEQLQALMREEMDFTTDDSAEQAYNKN